MVLFRSLVCLIFTASGLLAATAFPQLSLPKGANATWATPPGEAVPATARFDVDAKGGVWFLPAPRILVRADGLGLVLDQGARDLIFSKEGLRVSSDTIAGPLQLKKLKSGWTAKIKSQLVLPSAAWRLAKGGPDAVVSFGWDEATNQSVVVRLLDRRKVLEWPERVLAAEGTQDAWFLATPSGVQRVSRQGASSFWGTLPGGVSSLAWVEGAGLAVAGPQGAALFTSPGKRLPLVKSLSPRVRALGPDLYILLPEFGGVLKITGLGR